jgi:cell wall-associated NlpC family hydrolase
MIGTDHPLAQATTRILQPHIRRMEGSAESGSISIVLAIGAAAFLLFIAIITGATAGYGSGSAALTSCVNPITNTTQASAAIPPLYLALYEKAGQQYGISWEILAAIGKTESDHGRGTDPGIRSGANPSGAMGPMQFKASSWASYGVDGNADGKKDVYDPADAIPAAARKLGHDGAPQHMDQAIFKYNPADWYVRLIDTTAEAYANGQNLDPLTSTSCNDQSGSLPADLLPNAVAAKVIAFARAQIGKPYIFGAAGPDAYDCSGLTMRAYQSAGIGLPHHAADQWNGQSHVPPGQEQPGDLVFFVSDGTRSAPGHVGIYIGGDKTIIAPHSGTTVQIQSVHRSDFLGYARPQQR